MKNNLDFLDKENVILPLPPQDTSAEMEMEIYVRFMRYLRHAPSNSMEVKVLSSIHFTADMLDHSDALVAKVLVDLGLRASRRSFPSSYLEHHSYSMKRNEWEVGAPSMQARALNRYWKGIEGNATI
jgi:hypothetical protein